MSWRGKRKEEYASDGSGDTHARPKKADSDDESDDIVVCEESFSEELEPPLQERQRPKEHAHP
ncbi:hypothetical protein Pint_27429 [Pistacia integerrima]|uniref:Uncharacterized protein n=1 Tax=Pistacia integerrima TaxID=434235 RepID=A0ACC0YQH6_9ROSI|nr:hypothetical protein Pint_27429 [Pistacia integerrima]